MRKVVKNTVMILCFGLGLQLYAATSTNLDPLQAAIQTYYNQNQQAMHFSAIQMSVLLPGDSTPRDYVVGTQTYDGAVPATNDMMMQWGSVTKEYTDTLIFQLINKGVLVNGQPLTANTTLMQIFPSEFTQANSYSWPQAWANVTLTQLMNMTSGIADYTQLPSFQAALPPPQYSLESLVNLVVQYQHKNGCVAAVGCFKPGKGTFYSNTNYIILGMIVEKATGLSFDNAINQNILESFQNAGDPVDYYATLYPANILPQMMSGYMSLNGAWVDTIDWGGSWAASAGAMIGNMDTLAKMAKELYSNSIPNNSVTIAELQQNAVQQIDNGNWAKGQAVTNPITQCLYPNQLCYAMGLELNYVPQIGTIWYYVGNTPGFETIYICFPNGVVIAISQNAGDDPSNALQALVLQTIYPIVQNELKANR